MSKSDVLFMDLHQKHELSLFTEELYRYMSFATLINEYSSKYLSSIHLSRELDKNSLLN